MPGLLDEGEDAGAYRCASPEPAVRRASAPPAASRRRRAPDPFAPSVATAAATSRRRRSPRVAPEPAAMRDLMREAAWELEFSLAASEAPWPAAPEAPWPAAPEAAAASLASPTKPWPVLSKMHRVAKRAPRAREAQWHVVAAAAPPPSCEYEMVDAPDASGDMHASVTEGTAPPTELPQSQSCAPAQSPSSSWWPWRSS
jgi:hypothetical protein